MIFEKKEALCILIGGYFTVVLWCLINFQNKSIKCHTPWAKKLFGPRKSRHHNTTVKYPPISVVTCAHFIKLPVEIFFISTAPDTPSTCKSNNDPLYFINVLFLLYPRNVAPKKTCFPIHVFTSMDV